MTSFDQGYFEWLVAQVEPAINLNPKQTHQLLLAQLYQMSFVWSVHNDDNRCEDGRALRSEFLVGFDVDGSFAAADCSVLEMLIGLSRRAAFQSYGEMDDWFWHLLDNVGLADCTDERFGYYWDNAHVAYTMAAVMRRRYSRDGKGGFFPLQHHHQDQRKTEIWYQLAAYLMEGHGP